MQNKIENTRKIAKNALYLYVRMFLSMGVSLFTSRVVLNTLGVTDYGIWNVVAGIIIMFSFLNSSMVACTNRFLSYELGKKDFYKLQKIFATALNIHILISVIILLLGETIGLWFLNDKLVIPENRIFAAKVIYQITIISSIVSITQVPYNAMIMANERMNVYAYIEILNVTLKLLIVYMLYLSPWDKLITYGILTLFVTIIIAMSYRIYCVRKLKSCKYQFKIDKSVAIPMLSFSGWDLYGNAAVMARTQGVNMLLNIFFTATMNAASAIATQVQTAVGSFATNVLSAFRPQIVKTYANGERESMVKLIREAAVYTTFLLLLLTLPLILEIDYVLHLWLKNPPFYAAILCKYTLLFNIIANLSTVIVSGIHATGYIKRSSFINGTCYLLVIPFAYISYKAGMEAYYAYLFNVIAVCLGMTQNIFVLNKYVPEFKKKSFILNILLRYTVISFIIYFIITSFQEYMQQSFVRLCLSIAISTFILVSLTFIFIFNKNERILIKNKIGKVLRRNREV